MILPFVEEFTLERSFMPVSIVEGSSVALVIRIMKVVTLESSIIQVNMWVNCSQVPLATGVIKTFTLEKNHL